MYPSSFLFGTCQEKVPTKNDEMTPAGSAFAWLAGNLFDSLRTKNGKRSTARAQHDCTCVCLCAIASRGWLNALELHPRLLGTGNLELSCKLFFVILTGI